MDATQSIDQIKEIKDQLNGEVTELNHQVKQLKEYRNDMAIKSVPNGEQSVKSAFESLLNMTTNGLLHSGTYVQSPSLDHVYIPWQSCVTPTETTNCLACGQTFSKLSSSYEPAYYIHCIKECDEYKDLNLIQECDTCQKRFASKTSLTEHCCQQPTKPDWMLPSMYYSGIKTGQGLKKCLGCGGQFPSTQNSRYSFDHLVHMIEDCLAYKDLNLISECHECHYKFPDRRACNDHVTRTHLVKPKWMKQCIFLNGIKASRLKTNPVSCRGCGKELRTYHDGSISLPGLCPHD